MSKVGVVGATTLLGKELSEELAESPLAGAEIVLLDEDVVEGQISAAGDEASFVRPLNADSFTGLEQVFFAGSAELTRTHWQAARRAGAMVIDLTHALVGEPGVVLRAPGAREAMPEGALGLETAAVVVAHPMAATLATIAARLLPGVTGVVATVLLPASEHERDAMDELHQQTVSLLSFQELPRVQFDAQSAFNLLAALGEDAKASLAEQQQQIEADYRAVGGDRMPELMMQLVQAPVFHGYAASVLLEFAEPRGLDEIAKRLGGRGMEIVGHGEEAPSNVLVAGRREVLVRLQRGSPGMAAQRRVWLWLAADNLKLRAANAIGCAMELRRVTPSGKVQ